MTMSCRGIPAAALLLGGCAVLLLGGCAAQPQSPQEAAAVAECRKQADDVSLAQNPGAVFRSDNYASSTRDAPFSSNGLIGVNSNGLSQGFARNNLMRDCMIDRGFTPTSPMGSGAISPGASP